MKERERELRRDLFLVDRAALVDFQPCVDALHVEVVGAWETFNFHSCIHLAKTYATFLFLGNFRQSLRGETIN